MTAPQDYRDRFCIVGAGSSGIAAARWLKAYGIPFDCIEREDDIGGNWYYGKPNSSVYRSTHLISSKTMTEYLDFPMPDDYPDYPNHRQVCAYLRSYARHFDLYPHIIFNTSIDNADSASDGGWLVTLSGAVNETRHYRGLVVANGHNWDPKFPDIPGEFHGVTLHSAEYKTPDVLRDKRVLVIGAGNSGCDIAVEAAQNAAQTFHSTRRGYWYVPKYAFGRPGDTINEIPIRMNLPVWMRRAVNNVILRVLVGDVSRYGLRKPDHKLLETHPIVNSQITYYLGHGDIIPKDDVAELCGDSVRFKDGSVEPVDVIVYATGFKISFPFMDVNDLAWNGKHPELYLNAFHPQRDDLFVIGLIQPDSGQFWIVDMQSQVMAQYIAAMDAGSAAATEFRQMKAGPQPDLSGGIRYLESTRHYVEIEHHSYRKHMKRLMRLLAVQPATP